MLSGTRTGSAAGTLTLPSMDTGMVPPPNGTVVGDVLNAGAGTGAGGAVDVVVVVVVAVAVGTVGIGAGTAGAATCCVSERVHDLLFGACARTLTPLVALHEVLGLLAHTLDTLVSDALLGAAGTWAAWQHVSAMMTRGMGRSMQCMAIAMGRAASMLHAARVYSHSSQVRWLFWHARQAFATFFLATLPSGRVFVRAGDALSGFKRWTGDVSDACDEADTEPDASEASLALRAQFWVDCVVVADIARGFVGGYGAVDDADDDDVGAAARTAMMMEDARNKINQSRFTESIGREVGESRDRKMAAKY